MVRQGDALRLIGVVVGGICAGIISFVGGIGRRARERWICWVRKPRLMCLICCEISELAVAQPGLPAVLLAIAWSVWGGLVVGSAQDHSGATGGRRGRIGEVAGEKRG